MRTRRHTQTLACVCAYLGLLCTNVAAEPQACPYQIPAATGANWIWNPVNIVNNSSVPAGLISTAMTSWSSVSQYLLSLTNYNTGYQDIVIGDAVGNPPYVGLNHAVRPERWQLFWVSGHVRTLYGYARVVPSRYQY